MSKPDEAPFAYDGLDRVIHEKARLGLLTSLMAHPKGLAFADLKQLCGLTDGNFSRHLQVLQEAGLVEVTKGYEGNRPQTELPAHRERTQALPRLSERARTVGARCSESRRQRRSRRRRFSILPA